MSSKISQLNAASALDGTELLSGVQGGSNVKMTPAQIKTFVQGSSAVLATSTWDISANPFEELSLSANSAITIINAVAGKSRGYLRVNNTGTFTLSINSSSVTIGSNGKTIVCIVVNSDGTIDATTQAVISINASNPTQLNAPTGLTATSISSTEIDLSWADTNSSPNESGYKVYRNTVNTFGTATQIGTPAANATSYNDTAAPNPSTQYFYWVVASGNGTTTTDSNPSSSANATTGAGGGTVLFSENFDGVTAPALPATLTYNQSFVTSTLYTGIPSAPNYLCGSVSPANFFIPSVVETGGTVVSAVSVRMSSGSAPEQVLIVRSTTKDVSTFSAYGVDFQNTSIKFRKYTSGSAAVLGSTLTYTAINTALMWFRVILKVVNNGTASVTLTVQVQRLSDSMYMDATGAFTSSTPVNVMSYTDSTSPILTPGYDGLNTISSAGTGPDYIGIDDFKITT